MNFSAALDSIKIGRRARRNRWQNTTKYYLQIELGKVPEGFKEMEGVNLSIRSIPIDLYETWDEDAISYPRIMILIGDKLVPWKPTMKDILADDWNIF